MIPCRREWLLTPIFLPWEFPWTEEPGRPQSTGSQRVRHDCSNEHLHFFSNLFVGPKDWMRSGNLRFSMPSQGSWFHLFVCFFPTRVLILVPWKDLDLFEAQQLFRPQFLCLFAAEDESLWCYQRALWLSRLAFKWRFIILSFLLYFSKASIKLSRSRPTPSSS